MKPWFGVPALGGAVVAFGRSWLAKGFHAALHGGIEALMTGLCVGGISVLLYIAWHLLRAPAEMDAEAQSRIRALEDRRDRRLAAARVGECYQRGCTLAASSRDVEVPSWRGQYEQWVKETTDRVAELFSEAKASLFRNVGTRPAMGVLDMPEELQAEGHALHYQLETLRQLLASTPDL
jgi:hypothetical protein